MKTATNLQDVFLNQVRKDHTPITIFLVNGYQLRGIVRGFDNYIIILDSEGKQQMVYKHAVSTISPLVPVRFTAAETEEADD
ncbi:MAG: RNA chaperone Hfq [Clostridia bacterium]|nr:RNA chaperone Hfq [Clostridia bacterium]